VMLPFWQIEVASVLEDMGWDCRFVVAPPSSLSALAKTAQLGT
jgi:hypothetical protein